MQSDNEFLKKEYNLLRQKVTKVLREIYKIKQSKDPDQFIDHLDSLKEKSKKSDVLVNGTLDKLIREKKINSAMATSLANDSEAIAQVSKNLIVATELLYIGSDTLVETVEEIKKKKKKKKK
jgi:phosphate:Na+ symporter